MLSDFGAQDSHAALNHGMRQISDWIQADNAFWIGSIRLAKGDRAHQDPYLGWRVREVRMLHPSPDADRRVRAGKKDAHSRDPSMSTRAVVSQAGKFRVYNIDGLHDRGLLDLKAFRKTRHYDDFYRKPGISDRIWAVFPVNKDVESMWCFDAYHASRRFSEDELALVGQTLKGIKWFHRQLVLAHGLYVGNKPLTDGQRQVLRELLSGSSEKDIAERLHLTPGTVHQYAVRIYRKFKVGSRAELMALWLNS